MPVCWSNQAEKSRSDGRARGAQGCASFLIWLWVGMMQGMCTEVGWTALGLAKEEVAEAVGRQSELQAQVMAKPDCGEPQMPPRSAEPDPSHTSSISAQFCKCLPGFYFIV